MAKPSGYIPTLDGWRAIAILFVIHAHALPIEYAQSRGLDNGVFGVKIFFGISGFLICSRLLADLRRTGGIDLNSFYIRRCFRILPPYLATWPRSRCSPRPASWPSRSRRC